jgi:hypothetical protein
VCVLVEQVRAGALGRGPLGLAADGFYLLSRAGDHGNYLPTCRPACGSLASASALAGVSVSVAVLTGARKEESGMFSGVNATGHEIGGTLGIAVFTSVAAAVSSGIADPAAATGIADAFLSAAYVALGAAAALLVLPAARTFLPKLRLSFRAMPIH